MKPGYKSVLSSAHFGDVPSQKPTSPVSGFLVVSVPQTQLKNGSAFPPSQPQSQANIGFNEQTREHVNLLCQSPDPNSMSSDDEADMELAALVHEDSGYSDTNPEKTADTSPTSHSALRTPSPRENQRRTPAFRPTRNSPVKRKRARKSRAKVQDPVEKNILRKTRRCRANDRERTRMHTLNDALEMLRLAVPCDGANGKMTKIETLRSAVNYISLLRSFLEEYEKGQAQENLAVTSAAAPNSLTPPLNMGGQQDSGQLPVRSASAGNVQYPQPPQYPYQTMEGFQAQRASPVSAGMASMLSVNTNVGAVSMERASPVYQTHSPSLHSPSGFPSHTRNFLNPSPTGFPDQNRSILNQSPSFQPQNPAGFHSPPHQNPSPSNFQSPVNMSPSFTGHAAHPKVSYATPVNQRASPILSTNVNSTAYGPVTNPSIFTATNIGSNHVGSSLGPMNTSIHSSPPAGNGPFGRYTPPSSSAIGQFPGTSHSIGQSAQRALPLGQYNTPGVVQSTPVNIPSFGMQNNPNGLYTFNAQQFPMSSHLQSFL